MNVYTDIECTSMIATNAGKNSRSAVRKGKMIVSGWQPREAVCVSVPNTMCQGCPGQEDRQSGFRSRKWTVIEAES